MCECHFLPLNIDSIVDLLYYLCFDYLCIPLITFAYLCLPLITFAYL